jgi:hypothetical protein
MIVMSKLLIIILNGEIIIEYKRNQLLAGLQRRFLDKMDADMNDGLKIEGEYISSPNKTQRVQYVANHIVNAVINGKQNNIQPACAYLVKVAPTLLQIKIDTSTAEHNFDLMFDN